MDRAEGEGRGFFQLRVAAAIVYGGACRGDGHGGCTCASRYTATNPGELVCVECGGAGCRACTGGYMTWTGCPRQLVRAGAWDIVEAADLARRGTWPLAGGWLDQTETCVDGVRFFMREMEIWDGRKNGKDHTPD